MDNYIFISYAHKDKKAVVKAIEALGSCGVNYWYDKGIKAGDDWAESIGTKLKGARVMVLFLSKHSAKSKNVRREIAFAAEHSIPILTVQLYKFKLPAELGKLLTVNQFSNLHSYRTYRSFAEAFTPVLAAYDVIGDAKTSFKDKRVRIKRRRVFGKILLGLVAAAAALVAVKMFCMEDIPSVVGLAAEPAEESIEASGFRCVVTNEYSEDEDLGYIIDQDKSGAGLKKSMVVITQSLGPESDLIVIPDVVGHHISEGVSMIVEAGMRTFIIDPVRTDEYEIAYIADQSISPNFKVSSKNRIQLKVSSDESTTIEIFGKKIRLSDQKAEIQILEDNSVVVTPISVYGLNAEYTASSPLNETGSIDVGIRISVNLDREDTEPYGKYRGSFFMNAAVTGDDSAVWKIATQVFGQDAGYVPINIESNALKIQAEAYDEEKYLAFVEKAVGSREYARIFPNSFMMILGEEIDITGMNSVASNMDWIYSLATKFVVALPKIEGTKLKQPFAVIIRENGDASILFYGDNGTDHYLRVDAKLNYGE